jgi:putative Mg2+ transporter-C (MgtC) family protein
LTEPTWNEWTLVVRLACAALAGAAIGWNRHRVGKPAGVGTHALVALGAGLFVVVPAAAGPAHADALSRVIQGVATGVGFLGAGEIFRDGSPGSRVTGLTSAAALWATAALGLVIVTGSLLDATAGTLLVLVILEAAPRLERRFPPRDPPASH